MGIEIGWSGIGQKNKDEGKLLYSSLDYFLVIVTLYYLCNKNFKTVAYIKMDISNVIPRYDTYQRLKEI